MSLYTLPNSTGIDQILIDTVSAVPSLTPLLLAFTFFIVFLGGSGMQKTRLEKVDFPMWAVVASLCTFMVALIMSMKSGLIQLGWLVIVLVVAIMSVAWLYYDRRSGEI